jgi:hypothetical protein
MADRPAPEGAPAADTASLVIDADPQHLYELVSDVARMGRISPECTGGRWLGGAAGPAVGARFKGTNRRGWIRWSTHNTVVAADPGREFAFETTESGIRWTYRFEPHGSATLVTESREAFKDRPLVAKAFALLLGGAEAHDDELRQGLVDTLERLRSLAETVLFTEDRAERDPR